MQKYKNLDEFFKDLKEPRKSEVALLRQIILEANKNLTEQLKWNAASYSYNGNDRITFNLFDKNFTRLVFHVGGTMKEDKKGAPAFKDETGLLEWKSNIRATITFNDVKQIQKHKNELIKIIRKWLEVFN